ncbi:MAG: PIN domain-containing protein, partial [Polaromonas sp.]|nr:PIN domain-containing protein [Polaromonas sp.]
MPLPPAPTKRAALLSPTALDAPSRPSTRLARKQEVAAFAKPSPVVGLEDSRTSGGGVKPLILKVKEPSSVLETGLDSYKKESIQRPRQVSKSPKTTYKGPAKLFVLDTNVLMHDPMCLFRFEEHDIFLPMIVLEELDGHKKGMTEVARNARQTSRSLDALAGSQGADIGKGLKLDTTGHREAGGSLFFQTKPLDYTLPLSLPQGKADNQILGVVEALRKEYAPREVVLVSKDINMRVKARALGLATDDYQSDKTLQDDDLLYSGSLALPADFWTRQSKTIESWQQGSHTFYRITGPIVPSLMINQFVYFEAPGEPPLYARVTEIR